MAKYRKLSHTVYQCNYHVVFTPKYRYRILEGKVKEIVEHKIRQVCEWYDVEIEELNNQLDHVHLLLSIPPKRSVSEVMGIIKGKSAIHIDRSYSGHERNYSGQNFWVRGYYASTSGRDGEVVIAYIRKQEELGTKIDQLQMF